MLKDMPLLIPIFAAALSTVGAFFGAWLSSRATKRSSENTLVGIQRQIELQTAIKIAEFKQGQIKDLRDCMAEFQAIGMTPGLAAADEREFYKFGTKIELMMNRSDSDYSILQQRMYDLLDAKTIEEKYACNTPFIEVCQSILKREWESLQSELRSNATDPSKGDRVSAQNFLARPMAKFQKRKTTLYRAWLRSLVQVRSKAQRTLAGGPG